MNYTVISLIMILGALSLLQRVIPWILYKRFTPGAGSQKFFDIVAVAAFSSLMVYNINSFDYQNIIPLIPAFIVALKTRKIGFSILVAMIFAFVLTMI